LFREPAAMSSAIDDVAALCANTLRTSTLLLRGVPAAAGWLLGWLSAEFAPHVLTGHALSALPTPLERKAAGLPAPLEAKLREASQGLTALGTSLEAKANATAEDAQTDAFLRDVNAKLASFNVELSSKGSVAREPRRFANAAAAIQRAVTGTALSVRGVNFAPCLVSASIRGASVGATAVVRYGLWGERGEILDLGWWRWREQQTIFNFTAGDNSKYRKKKSKNEIKTTQKNRTWPAGSSPSTRRPRRSRCRAPT